MAVLLPVPAVADADRYVLYTIRGAATNSADVPFPVYGDATDIQIAVDGTILDPSSYSLVSKSGIPLGLLSQPVTDGQVLFFPAVAPQVLEITGAVHPRQASMPANGGIGRREFNQIVGYVVSIARELRRAVTTKYVPALTPSGSGPLALRPAAGSVAANFVYLATDDVQGRLVFYVSNGVSAWSGPLVGTGPQGIAGVNGTNGVNGTSISLKNRILNGNFCVNERAYVSGTAIAADIYAHDKWKAGAGGGTYTFSPGALDTLITVTAGTVAQVVWGKNAEGGTYTLSWSGTAQGRVNGGSYASSPITVAGLTAGSNITVEFNTGTLGLVQLEPGASASTFERRPRSYEERECEAYFRWLPISISGQTGAGYNVTAPLHFPKMIGIPSLGSPVADPALSQGSLNVTSYSITSPTRSSAVVNALATIGGAFDIHGYRVPASADL